MLRVEKHLLSCSRDLEKEIYKFLFKDGKALDIVQELKMYQNDDGGFGHGLEPDFWMKESSAMATSIGLSHLTLIDHDSDAKEMIKKAIAYLEATFDGDRFGWFAVSEKVNDYPHAPWWTFDKTHGQTMIDDNWGNPTAELIGYLIRYKRYVKTLNIHELIEYAITHYTNESKLESEHEVYCYIRLYHELDKKGRLKLYPRVQEAVAHLINPEMDQWTNYVPMPLNFIEPDSEETFEIGVQDLHLNLDYFIDKLDANGCIEPVWSWDDYMSEWIVSKEHWTGILTLQVLRKLKQFNRMT